MATVTSPSSPDTSPQFPLTIPVLPPSSSTPILLPTQVPLLTTPSINHKAEQQRKLRHIRGLLCRNISLSPQSRARSSTLDDDELKTSWQSPSKQLLAEEVKPSMSSSDLKEMARRPAKVMRRRSTRVYHLGALEDSISRQQRWEKVVETRLVDLFFTLHRTRQGYPPLQPLLCAVLTVDDPLYISEQVFETMVLPFYFYGLMGEPEFRGV